MDIRADSHTRYLPERLHNRTPFQAAYSRIINNALLTRYINAVLSAAPRKWTSTTLVLRACVEAYAPQLIDPVTGHYTMLRPRVNDRVMGAMVELQDRSSDRRPISHFVEAAVIAWMNRNVVRLTVFDRETAIFTTDDDIVKLGPSSAPPLTVSS